MILNPQQKRPQAHCRGKRQPKLRPALQTHRSVLFVLVLLLVATLTVPPARAHVFDRCDTSSYAVFPTSFSFDHAQTLRNYSAASDGSWAQLAMQVDADGLWEVHAFVRCGFNTTEHPDFNSTGMVTQVHAVPPRGLALTDTLQAGYVGYGIVRPYAIRAFQEPDYLTGTLFKALAEVGYIHGWACNASTPGSLCGAPYAVGCTPTTQEFIEPGTYACAGDFGNLTHLQRLLENTSLNIDVFIVSQVDADWRQVLRNGTLRPAEQNVSVLFLGEDYESTPLGRAEYVKLFGLLFGIPTQTSEQFRDIVRSYEEAKGLAQTAERRPSVLYGYAYDSTFYFGSKYQATFIRDANAYYVFGENDEELPQELAYCFDNGIALGKPDTGLNLTLLGANSSQFWTGFSITTPTEKTVAQVLQNYTYARNWTAVLCDNLFDATKYTDPNPIFEQGVLRPDLILRDQIRIFHPELEPEYVFNFYRHMEPSGLRTCPIVTPVPSSRAGVHVQAVYMVRGIPRVLVESQQQRLRDMLVELLGIHGKHISLWYPTNASRWLSNAVDAAGVQVNQSLVRNANGSVFLVLQVYTPESRDLASTMERADVALMLQQTLRSLGVLYANATLRAVTSPIQNYVGASGSLGNGLPTGAIVGIVIGTFIGGVIITALGAFMFIETRYRKRKRRIWRSGA